MASAEPQSGGIRLLLQAEQDAQRIITNARAGMFTDVLSVDENVPLKRSSLWKVDRGVHYGRSSLCIRLCTIVLYYQSAWQAPVATHLFDLFLVSNPKSSTWVGVDQSLRIIVCWWVSLALTAKTARLRQAKEEAEKESAAYRAQREEEYQNKKSGVRRICTFSGICRTPSILWNTFSHISICFTIIRSAGDVGRPWFEKQMLGGRSIEVNISRSALIL